MSYTNCIVPGDNARIVPEPKDTGPPDGFIDSTVYRYKMINGEKVLIGTQEPFPEGSQVFNKNLKCRLEDIESERGDSNMPKKVKLGAPANLEQVWIDSNYKIDKVAKAFNVGWAVARRWLQEAKLIDSFGTPKVQTSDPAQAATKEPDQSDMSADTSIPEKEITVKDVLLYELEQQEDFTVDDDKPIPYSIAPSYDLAPIKIQLIATALAEYKDEQLPAFIALRLVKAIGDIELGVE